MEAGLQIPLVRYDTTKGLLLQVELFVKTCKKCKKIKNRKTIYGQLLRNIIASLKPWDSLYIDLIGTYYYKIINCQSGGVITKKGMSLACMPIINPVSVWFDISESLASTSLSYQEEIMNT